LLLLVSPSAVADAPTLDPEGYPADPKFTDEQVRHWFNYGIFQVSGDHALVRTGNVVHELIDGPETFAEMANAIRTASKPAETTTLPAVVAEYQFGLKPNEPTLFSAPGLLAEGKDKCIYSTSPQGGKDNRGLAFKITPDLRTMTVVHQFDLATGCGPLGGLSLIGDNFYGTTYGGGKYSAGVIFRIAPDGAYTDLWDFRNGKILDPPPYPKQPSEQEKLDAAGSYPGSGPINGAHGGMFGVTTYANNQQGGVLYSGTLKGLYQFKGECGYLPATLIAGSDGNLYGACVKGNASCPFGAIFKATPAGAVSLLHPFTNAIEEGGQPFALTMGKDGVLYGVTAGGGYPANFPGVLFSLTTDGTTFKVIHKFTGGVDGGWPSAGLVEKDGYLYGATRGGGIGPLGRGVLYRLKPTGEDFTTLHYFDFWGNGKNPSTSLLLHSNGAMYGTTSEGGAKNARDHTPLDNPPYG
jgi:uncharacterized repeat protein (TIGR03803 family)